MNRFVKLSAAGLVAVLSFGALTNSVEAKKYTKAITKIAGNGNYAIYQSVSATGPTKKFTSTRYFKYGQIQSKESRQTKKGTFWNIYVDGRHVGWVNQNFFARNKISVATNVSLVKNPSYDFNPKDAINYVTDSQGTAINPAKVIVSKSAINSGQSGVTKVTYSFGKSKASTNVTVRSDDHEANNSSTSSVQKGFSASSSTWNGSSKSSSKNWNKSHGYRSESSANTFRANGLTLTTRLYQPRFVSLGYGQSGDVMGQVGVIPEGIAVNGNQFTASMFTTSISDHGHLVNYNLGMMNRYDAQNLTSMSWNKFKKYTANIKVSPYIKLGHGQSLGSSSSYIYVLANNNNYTNGPASEEVLQIRRSDMKINQIWTIRIAANRYIHNATFVGDNTMYALFHNGGHNKYEYWKLTRNGDSWQSSQVGSTQGKMVTNSPVQGFTYSNGNFFIAFNDHLYRVKENGTAVKHYKFNVRREIEGLSASNNKLFVEFAQRAELTQGKI